MLTIPKGKIAVVPIFDSKQTESGLHIPDSFEARRKEPYYVVLDEREKIYAEKESYDEAVQISKKLLFERNIDTGVVKKYRDESHTLDSTTRCDQGIVKYIGEGVNDYEKGIINLRVGDYVLFSGYVGTLVQIDGEGKVIIMPAKFVEATVEIDEYMEIPGMYYRTRNKREGYELQGASAFDYGRMTFEIAMELIARAFTDQGRTIPVHGHKPKLEDYNA